MLRNLLGKINLFAKIKAFLDANPQGAKFIGFIALIVIIPLTVATALTVQNFKQHAGGRSLVILTDQDRNALGSTSNPNVFIDINLDFDPNWILPQSQSTTSDLIKQAYAQTEQPPQTIELKPSPKLQTSSPSYSPPITQTPIFDPWIYDADGDGLISLSETLKAVNDYNFKKNITAAERDQVIALWKSGAKKPVPTATPSPSGIILTGEITCPPDQFPNKDGVILSVKVQPEQNGEVTIWEDGVRIGGLAYREGNKSMIIPSPFIHPKTIEIKFSTGAQANQGIFLATANPAIDCPYFGTQNITPSPSPTPAPNILRAVYIESLDSDGSKGGSDPIKIIVNSKTDIDHIPWRLNDLLPDQTQAPRTVKVTLIGDAAITSATSTINLLKPNGPTPTISPVPPVVGFGKAASLDGSTAYLTIQNSEKINPQLGFTAEAWIKPNAPEFSGYNIFSKMSSNQNGFAIGVRSTSMISLTGDIKNTTYSVTYTFSVTNSGNDCAFHSVEQTAQGVSASQIMSWQHVAGVIQPDGTMDIFVNGQRSKSNFNKISGICKRDMPIQIGARLLTGGADGYFPGLIDEARISNSAIYTSNFSPSNNPFSPNSDTVVLYHFDGDVKDSSGNGNNGTINGNVQFVDSTIGVFSTPTPTPKFTQLNPPQLLTPTNGALNVSRTPTLTWTPVAGAQCYFVRYYRYAVGDRVEGKSTAETSYAIPLSESSSSLGALLPNTVYHWTVKAINNTCAEADANTNLWWGVFSLSKEWAFTTTTSAPASTTTLPIANANYDLNRDGRVNCKDTKILVSQYGQKGANLSADSNHDGVVNSVDYNTLLRNYTPGDTTKCL